MVLTTEAAVADVTKDEPMGQMPGGMNPGMGYMQKVVNLQLNLW